MQRKKRTRENLNKWHYSCGSTERYERHEDWVSSGRVRGSCRLQWHSAEDAAHGQMV